MRRLSTQGVEQGQSRSCENEGHHEEGLAEVVGESYLYRYGTEGPGKRQDRKSTE